MTTSSKPETYIGHETMAEILRIHGTTADTVRAWARRHGREIVNHHGTEFVRIGDAGEFAHWLKNERAVLTNELLDATRALLARERTTALAARLAELGDATAAQRIRSQILEQLPTT